MATYYRNSRILCAACNTDICDNYYTRCSNERCNTPFYHNHCVGATTTTRALDWLCNKCRNEHRRRECTLLVHVPETLIQQISQHHMRSTRRGRRTFVPTPHVGPTPGVQHATHPVPPPKTQIRFIRSNQHACQTTNIRARERENENIEATNATATTAAAATNDIDPHIASLSDEILQLRREIAVLNEQFVNVDNVTSVNNSEFDNVNPALTAAEIRHRQNQKIEELFDIGQSILRDKLQNLAKMFGILKLYDELIDIAVSTSEDDGDELDESDDTRAEREKIFEIALLMALAIKKRMQRIMFHHAQNSTGNVSTEDINNDAELRRVRSNERQSRETRNLSHETTRAEGPNVRLANHRDFLKKLISHYSRFLGQSNRNQPENT